MTKRTEGSNEPVANTALIDGVRKFVMDVRELDIEHRKLIHKIGVTGGKVETRIANAAHDATHLIADVKVVANYGNRILNLLLC